MEEIRNTLPNEPPQLSTGGNPIRHAFSFKSPDDWVFKLHKQLGTIETNQEPYCQVAYGEEADGSFLVVTYCEGDVDYVTCKTRADLDRELQAARDFYVRYQ